MIRILVTGSRAWPWARADDVRRALNGAHSHILDVRGLPAHDTTPVTLVSGHCPRGVDAIAEAHARRIGWHLELHPADWDRHRRGAGHIRNQAMADAGADCCVALVWGGHSPGTRDMIRRAQAAGIPTIVHEGNGDG